MAGHLEIEHKYDVEPDFVPPDPAGLPACAAVSEPETHTLVARYYDTEDLRLAARGITLRRRQGGHDEGWHLKLPVGDGAKREVHAPLGRGHAVPARLARLVAAHTRGRPLRRVATLETRRTVVRLLGETGDVLAEIADDRVTGRPASGPEETWREIEVELAAGPPELLKAAGKRLRKAGAWRAGASSKLARLLDGAGGAPAGPAAGRPVPDDERATAGDVVVAYVARQAETILDYDPRARLAEDDAVHQMRVAVRRIRSVLRTCGALFDAARTAPLEAELKWLTDLLGEVRDLEVQRERFARGLARIGADSPAWLSGLEERQRAAHARLNRALTQGRYFALLDALDAFVADPPFAEKASRRARREMPALVARAWRRMLRAHAGIDGAEDPDEAWHRTRKAAKRARYTAEAAVPALGASAKRLARQAAKVQEAFGAYQDTVIARRRLAELNTGGEDAFVLGVLTGLEHCAAEQALRDARKVWTKAARLSADLPADR